MQNREQLITSLVNDLTVQPKQWKTRNVAIVWWLCSWAYIVLATLLAGSLRPDVYHDITHNHQFQIESFIGLSASLFLALTAWYSATPGALTRRLLFFAITLLCVWILFYFIGIYAPAIEPSMHGKRAHCYFESFLYSGPPMLLACIMMSKRLPLQWYQSGLLIGLASGIMPALFMQFACMYDPIHILQLHVLPGLSMGIIGMMIFPAIIRYKK